MNQTKVKILNKFDSKKVNLDNYVDLREVSWIFVKSKGTTQYLYK